MLDLRRLTGDCMVLIGFVSWFVGGWVGRTSGWFGSVVGPFVRIVGLVRWFVGSFARSLSKPLCSRAVPRMLNKIILRARVQLNREGRGGRRTTMQQQRLS